MSQICLPFGAVTTRLFSQRRLETQKITTQKSFIKTHIVQQTKHR